MAVSSKKSLILLSTLFWGLMWLVCACTRPLDADFKGEPEGLGDDELIWILQVDRLPTQTGDSIPERLALRYRQFNQPLFEQVIPLLLADLQSGELEAFDNFEVQGEERPLEDLGARLAELGATWQDVTAFVQSCQLYTRGTTKNKRFESQPEYLRILWTDPKGVEPTRTFVNLRIADLRSKNYSIVIRGEEMKLANYLQQNSLLTYPVYVRSNVVDYRLRSREEADYLKDKVEQGDWNEVKWVENGINISGKDPIPLSEEQLTPFAGKFNFSLPSDTRLSDSTSRTLFLSTGPGYLVADWSDRLNVEKIHPWKNDAFFTWQGETYVFLEDGAEMEWIGGKDTLRGVRETGTL